MAVVSSMSSAENSPYATGTYSRPLWRITFYPVALQTPLLTKETLLIFSSLLEPFGNQLLARIHKTFMGSWSRILQEERTSFTILDKLGSIYLDFKSILILELL